MSEILPPRLRAALAVTLVASLHLSSLSLYFGDAMAEVQGDGVTVWIPPKMLAGERYTGLAIAAGISDAARQVLLVSSSPAVVVPERITIEPGMHQATFSIDLQPTSRPASATVTAVMGGAFGEAGAVLYDSQAGANGFVRLLAFNSTSLSFARVVAVAGQPGGIGYQPAATESDVTLVYPGGTARVTINGETGYGVADVPLVDGANRISVFGRPGDEITVTRTAVEPAVAVQVTALSMIPAWTPEWGYQRSWVLVDAERNGKPLRGEFAVIVTSSNPDVLDIEKNITTCRLPCAIPVRGHTEGEAQVGVQVTGIGGGTIDLSVVPPVRYMAGQADVEGLARKYIAQSVGTSTQFVVNSTSLSSHASEKAVSSAVTDGPVYGLVGHYANISANYTTIQVIGNMTTLTPGQISKTVPLVIPGVKYYMASDGPAQAEWSFFSGLLKGDIGHASSALTGGVPTTVVKSASVGIGSSHAAISSFDVQLSEPVGAAELKGELTAISIPEAGVRLAGYLVNGTVRGYLAENKGVSLGTPASSPVTDSVQVQPAQTGTQLQVDVPPIVYPAEGFVFAAHIAQGGMPLQRIDPLYELGRADPDRAGEVQEVETVFIHSSSRQVAKVTVSAVMNAIDLHVLWPEVLKLDRPHEIAVVASVPDTRIQVSGDVRGMSSGDSGSVTLYPTGAEGDKRVVISASKTGWTTATAEKVMPAKRYVSVTIDAYDAKGESVSAPFVMEYETVDGDMGRIQDTTPYMFDVRPFSSQPALTFHSAPAEANDGSSYVYRSVRETESGFTGIFERQTRLTVVNGAGSGYYTPGQSVHVEANPDSPILGFAVVEKFSHWEYDSESVYMRDRTARVQEVIAGEVDASMTAVYVTDFATLAVLVLSTAAAVGVYAYREEIRTIMEAYRKRT